jgi:hypothetical protein
MINLTDIAGPPMGRLHIEAFRDGQLFDVLDEKNLIVDVSKTIHSRLLGGATTGKIITKIGFGTNGTAPSAGNTSLTGPYIKLLDSVSYPTSNQVQFNFSLGSSENNGVGILEFGLISGDGSLYARRVRAGALSKESDISLTGYWTITF